MSSILKALKKLEDENPPKGRSVVWPSGSAPRRAIRRWDISSGWSAVLLWGLLAVVVLISVGGIFLYLLSPSDRNAVPTASVGQPVAKPILESLPPETVAKLPPQPVGGEDMSAYVRDRKPGVILVGSHVRKTSEQLAHLLEHTDVAGIEVDVSRLNTAAAGEWVDVDGDTIALLVATVAGSGACGRCAGRR